MGQSINEVHQQGIDLHGALGGDFFHFNIGKGVPSTGAGFPDSVPALSLALKDAASLTLSDYIVQAQHGADGTFAGLALFDARTGYTVSDEYVANGTRW